MSCQFSKELMTGASALASRTEKMLRSHVTKARQTGVEEVQGFDPAQSITHF